MKRFTVYITLSSGEEKRLQHHTGIVLNYYMNAYDYIVTIMP